ncbi:hypothetical protein OH799_35635 [Nocardia sp. NBC_00881]|uniref:hypothetical protein n=1 Tax=Nocardia sp. NBC_00881 TaxID=2975995 RepID=UPI00386AFCFD|nr:hypothetical protein OH799_35635 [Nocardia sp. NBC_00881]
MAAAARGRLFAGGCGYDHLDRHYQLRWAQVAALVAVGYVAVIADDLVTPPRGPAQRVDLVAVTVMLKPTCSGHGGVFEWLPRFRSSCRGQ